MECKFCGAQLDEETTLCPVCAKDNAEEAVAEDTAVEDIQPVDETEIEQEPEQTAQETPAQPGAKLWMAILAGVGILALLAVLAGAIVFGVQRMNRANDIYYKENYAVDEGKAEKVSDDQIAFIEDVALDNAQLQVYYNMTVNDFVNYYGYYLTTIGLDVEQPLASQSCPMGADMNWQQYFLDNSLTVWHRYMVLNLLAQEEGYTLNEELAQELENLPTQIEAWAQQYGFEDAQSMLEEDFGPICNLDAYMAYMKTYYLAMQYQEDKYVSIEPTAEEVEQYFTENEASFAESDITLSSGKYYDVRHILLKPEGGTTDDNGQTIYTDEEWAACLVEAEALLEQWQTNGGTEDAFATLAATYSTDTGSSSNGGLYSQLTTETSFVDEFKQWYLDESRQIGDTGIVQSVYGYHIMYFSGSQEIWFYNAKTSLLTEKWNALIEEGLARWPMEIDYKKIALSERSQEEATAATETTQ